MEISVEQFQLASVTKRVGYFRDACKKRDNSFLITIINDELSSLDFSVYGQEMFRSLYYKADRELMELFMNKAIELNQPVEPTDNILSGMLIELLESGNRSMLEWVFDNYDCKKVIESILTVDEFNFLSKDTHLVKWICENSSKYGFSINLFQVLELQITSHYFSSDDKTELLEWLWNNLESDHFYPKTSSETTDSLQKRTINIPKFLLMTMELGNKYTVETTEKTCYDNRDDFLREILTNEDFYLCCKYQHINMIKWLWEKATALQIPIDLHYSRDDIPLIQMVCCHGMIDLADWLWQKAIENETPYYLSTDSDDYPFINTTNFINDAVDLHCIEAIQWICQKALEENIDIKSSLDFSTLFSESIQENNFGIPKLEITQWIWDTAVEQGVDLSSELNEDLLIPYYEYDEGETSMCPDIMEWLFQKYDEHGVSINYIKLFQAACYYYNFGVMKLIWDRSEDVHMIDPKINVKMLLSACLNEKYINIRDWIYRFLPSDFNLSDKNTIRDFFKESSYGLKEYEWLSEKSGTQADPTILFIESLNSYNQEIAEWVWDKFPIDLNQLEIYKSAVTKCERLNWLWAKSKESGQQINLQHPVFQSPDLHISILNMIASKEAS